MGDPKDSCLPRSKLQHQRFQELDTKDRTSTTLQRIPLQTKKENGFFDVQIHGSPVFGVWCLPLSLVLGLSARGKPKNGRIDPSDASADSDSPRDALPPRGELRGLRPQGRGLPVAGLADREALWCGSPEIASGSRRWGWWVGGVGSGLVWFGLVWIGLG